MARNFQYGGFQKCFSSQNLICMACYVNRLSYSPLFENSSLEKYPLSRKLPAELLFTQGNGGC